MFKLFIKSILVFAVCSVLLLYPKFIKCAHASYIFSDDFNRADSTSLGSNWVLFFGGQPAGIENNRAYIQTDAGDLWGFYKVENLNIQNQDVSVTFTHQNGDTTLLARVIDLNNRIAINYYQSGNLQIYEVINGNYRLIPNTAPSAVIGNTYTVRTRIVGDSIKVWVNGAQCADATLNQVTSGSAGFGANDGYTKVFFDNFNIENIPDATPTPVATIAPTDTPNPTATPTVIPTETPTDTPTLAPTPLPTATPTSTPTLPMLSVPSLKQYSQPWKNKIYDHTRNTINEFGCALTSAAMVLQYHGHHNVLPDSLNKWLTDQNDGYIRNGLINWLAVSRYTKLHDSLNSPTLEYKRINPTNENLDNELNNSRPAILKENGHFVVATGKTENSYTINDPGYANRTTLESYNNSFLAINSYTPTHSDLSYMMFVVDENVNLEIINSSGTAIPVESYVDEPITNLNKNNKKSGEKVKVVLFEKPANGKYLVKLTGPKGSYALDSYLYDTTGKVTKNEFEGNLRRDDVDTYSVSFEGKKKINEKDRNEDYRHWFRNFWNHFKNWR